MSSPFVTVRYPDGAWELALTAKVPKVGDTLRRSGGKWVVANAAEDQEGTHRDLAARSAHRRSSMSKSADKPKKQLKKQPQRTLKERRSEKRAAKKLSSGSLRSDE